MNLLLKRSHQVELMDDPTISYFEFAETLKQLEQINRQTRAYFPTLEAMEYFLNTNSLHSSESLRILDIGFGYGDSLRKVFYWAEKKGITVELSGVDLNPWSKKAAEQATPKKMKISYQTKNIFEFKPKKRYHIIFNSLMTHHLIDKEIVQLMRWMAQNSLWGWFINDLHRHFVPYYFIRIATSLGRFNRLIRNDAPLSVARAFVRKDWKRLIDQSRLNPQQLDIRWHWPFRLGVRYDCRSEQ